VEGVLVCGGPTVQWQISNLALGKSLQLHHLAFRKESVSTRYHPKYSRLRFLSLSESGKFFCTVVCVPNPEITIFVPCHARTTSRPFSRQTKQRVLASTCRNFDGPASEWYPHHLQGASQVTMSIATRRQDSRRVACSLPTPLSEIDPTCVARRCDGSLASG
jgi:hypothetical protein